MFAISSACYSYYWDLKYDWGFLEPNSKFKILRNKLSYNNPKLYYFAMGINALLRLTWALSISQDIYARLNLNKTVFTFLISFLEMFRRC